MSFALICAGIGLLAVSWALWRIARVDNRPIDKLARRDRKR